VLELFSTGEAWVSLATLASLEIVLGIDNVVFISILAGRVARERRHAAMRLGLAGALVTRLLLLAALSWVMGLSRPLFAVLSHPVSGRDLILVCGGLFLIAKATFEIYDRVEAAHPTQHARATPGGAGMAAVVTQIMLLDIVFSLDSVITAVGMVDHLVIMAVAIVLAVAVMLLFAAPVGDFVERHPSIKLLALSFLVLIGVLLVAEGTGQHFPKGYVYFAMAFSLGVELLNMRYRQRQERLLAARSPVSRAADG